MSNNQIVDQAIELEHRGEEKLDELAAKDGELLIMLPLLEKSR
jgi:hypothetical protein